MPTDLAPNVLYYGDNLDILRRYLPAAAVDLVYLDPPLNSNRDSHVIFRDESGTRAGASVRRRVQVVVRGELRPTCPNPWSPGRVASQWRNRPASA